MRNKKLTDEQVDQAIIEEKQRLESERKVQLDSIKEKFQSEIQAFQEGETQKHTHKLEEMRNNLSNKHQEV